MHIAEVIERTHQEHRLGQCSLSSGQRAGASCEPGDPLAEGRIEPLNEDRVERVSEKVCK